jgi:iron complex outermembrane receptor protein
MSVNILRYVLAAFLVLFITIGLKAQHSSTIQLKDIDSDIPIIGASYQYKDQHGISDKEGKIRLFFIENQSLEFSHISYGRWILNPDEVADAIKSGTITRTEFITDISPVTVIGIRGQSYNSESLNIDDEDRISHDGGSLLNQTPEIAGVRKSGSYGFDPVLRGFKQEQIKILIDGCQSSIAACPNRMDPPTSQISPNMIDNIQVMKGPHSLRYGNGLGGTINYVSSKTSFSESGKMFGRFTGGYESNGNIYRGEGLIGYEKKKYNLGFFGSWSQGFNYVDGNDNEVLARFKRASVGTIMAFKIAEKQKLTLSVTRNFARDVDFPALAMDLRNDDTWLLNLKHAIYFSDRTLQSWKTVLYGTYVDHLMNNFLKDLNPRIVNAETDAKTISAGGRTEGRWKFTDNVLFTGIDYRYESAEGIRTREFLKGPNKGKVFKDNAWQHGQISNTGLFGEFQLNSPLWLFVFSGRIDINRAGIIDPAPEFIAIQDETGITQVNPGLSIGGLRQFNAFKIGLWFGHAQRSASLTERYINYFSVGQDPYEMLGNPMLSPESNNQIDLTFSFESEVTALELSLFSSFIGNYISSEIVDSIPTKLPTSPGVRVYKNVDRAFLGGFEFSWAQKIVFGIKHQLAVAYTYGQNKSDGEPLPEIAPLDLRYALMGAYINGKLKPKISFRYVMEQRRIAESFGGVESPGFFLMDIDLSYKITKAIRLTAGVYNLLNNSYYEFLNRPVRGTDNPIYAPGRSFLITLSVDLM